MVGRPQDPEVPGWTSASSKGESREGPAGGFEPPARRDSLGERLIVLWGEVVFVEVCAEGEAGRLPRLTGDFTLQVRFSEVWRETVLLELRVTGMEVK